MTNVPADVDRFFFDSWLERATLQENQARSMRTNFILAGISSFLLAATSTYFSHTTLLLLYMPYSIMILLLNHFYGRKTAAWRHSAEKIQDIQIGLWLKKELDVGDIKNLDQIYKEAHQGKYKRLSRMDAPTKKLIFLLCLGFAFLFLKFLHHHGYLLAIHQLIGLAIATPNSPQTAHPSPSSF